jgi:predicted nucleic acid-binding protein
MRFFLDANVIIDIANETADASRILKRLDVAGPKNCALSTVTIEELHYGVLSGPAVQKAYQVRNLKTLIAQFSQVDFTADAARCAAMLRWELNSSPARQGGKPPGAADLLLAGHAVSTRRVLVSADSGFTFLKGVKLQNWRSQYDA